MRASCLAVIPKACSRGPTLDRFHAPALDSLAFPDSPDRKRWSVVSPVQEGSRARGQGTAETRLLSADLVLRRRWKGWKRRPCEAVISGHKFPILGSCRFADRSEPPTPLLFARPTTHGKSS